MHFPSCSPRPSRLFAPHMKLLLLACTALPCLMVLAKDSQGPVLQEAKTSEVLKSVIDVALGKEANDGASTVGFVLSPEQIDMIQSALGVEMTESEDDAPDVKRRVDNSAIKHRAFPGDLRGLGAIDDMMKGQLESLIKVAGVELPTDLDARINNDKIDDLLSWYNMTWLAFNLSVSYVFGDGLLGGVVVASLLATLFVVLPWALRKRRERAMTRWLTAFYMEHAPDSMLRIPKAVEAYMQLPRGFDRMKADVIKKYITNADETKKTK
ncbi:hypothetical protein SPRG_16164 [Saprolegnia parasitica CBS 223.65]|uniref:Uncharacterized protein n=1 Tax=Saprolegnia parasitica (strain CBS 223.65) TaxID=695850 RepID=A0A067BW27_SAPPC|nr:hypothetical protein SPRG_16164 [Saprolegnia parasitica CBS 223.65]KDO18506.1 hypothetical protein SPRG_16164 [Saprolegnia parasitica CBS 223.65]|eukprot:XP_012210783.1 hypothetical protein SPRG_16164 [Saprolegnia parasitica CBS 223.65]